MAKNDHKLSSREKLDALKVIPIFRETPESTLAEVAALMQEETYQKEDVIFNEGDHGDCMFIIHTGDIRIHKGNTDLAVLNENEVFGELSLLDAETRSATATASSDSILYKIDQEPFYKLISTRPEISLGIIRILARRLRAQNEKSVSLNR
jgi:CRP-like cAMP-binding protein